MPGPATDAARAEARDRFDRGLRLFNTGDNAGALVEFRRAFELVENVLVLYNIGLVYAQMGRAVEAADALERVLANPGSLSPERIAFARKIRDEQKARVAEVSVEANVEAARIEVDGLEAGKTPLSAPLRVTSGTHVIAVIAPGYAPQRKEIAVAGGEKQSAKFDLVAMQGRMAHLMVKTHVPGADLYADDQRIGTTPLSASVSLPPGPHRIELRRGGYATAGADMTLGDGAMGEVALEPTEDPSAIATSGGALALNLSESQSVLTIDGLPRGVYRAPLRLAAGPHHLLVERGDFLPLERDFNLDPGRTTTIPLALEPTPDYRTRYESRARSQRTWGFISVIGGVVLVGGGVGLVVYDASQRSDGNAKAASLSARIQSMSGDPVCDPARGNDLTSAQYQAQCSGPLAAADAQVTDANTRDYFAWGAVGLGAAGAALGTILLLTADDPHRYDQPNPTSLGATLWRAVPSFWTRRGGGGVSWSGAF
jgi:hypothetical protein